MVPKNRGRPRPAGVPAMRRPGQYEPQKTTRVADYDFDDDDDDYPDPSDYVYYHEELAKKEREQQKKQEMKRPVLKMPMMVPTMFKTTEKKNEKKTPKTSNKKSGNKKPAVSLAGWRSALLRNRYFSVQFPHSSHHQRAKVDVLVIDK